jgi:hypothetical protein
MNVEHFASSLIGEQGPNDLVRKFTVGPIHRTADDDNTTGSCSLRGIR